MVQDTDTSRKLEVAGSKPAPPSRCINMGGSSVGRAQVTRHRFRWFLNCLFTRVGAWRRLGLLLLIRERLRVRTPPLASANVAQLAEHLRTLTACSCCQSTLYEAGSVAKMKVTSNQIESPAMREANPYRLFPWKAVFCGYGTAVMVKAMGYFYLRKNTLRRLFLTNVSTC